MIRPRFIVNLPNSSGPERFIPLVHLLEALTKVNEYHLRRGLALDKPYPRLYRSGVVYREEKPGREDWPDIPAILSQGWGDCEDLASYLTAERRVYDGIDARTVIKWKKIPAESLKKAGYPKSAIPPDGVFLVHCMTQWPDGRVEDPSKVLGMRGEYS